MRALAHAIFPLFPGNAAGDLDTTTRLIRTSGRTEEAPVRIAGMIGLDARGRNFEHGGEGVTTR